MRVRVRVRVMVRVRVSNPNPNPNPNPGLGLGLGKKSAVDFFPNPKPNPNPNPGLGLGLGKKSAADFFRRKKLADFVRRGQSPPCSFGRLLPWQTESASWQTKSASWQTKSVNWRTQAEPFASRHFSGLFLAAVRQLMADLIGSAADLADFFRVRLSRPESASADWLADPIGSDPIRRELSPPIIVPFVAESPCQI